METPLSRGLPLPSYNTLLREEHSVFGIRIVSCDSYMRHVWYLSRPSLSWETKYRWLSLQWEIAHMMSAMDGS
jgi:hypothetical protein